MRKINVAQAYAIRMFLNMAENTKNEGLELRASAIQKIEQARIVVDSARHDLCNLEGAGYCARYEELGEIERRFASIAEELKRMKPPTGVFHI
jgi:transcription elongation GreA/GreB family factor